MSKYELRKEYMRAKNIQHVYLNNKKTTIYDIYILSGGTWLFSNTAYISGHYKSQKKLLNNIL